MSAKVNNGSGAWTGDGGTVLGTASLANTGTSPTNVPTISQADARYVANGGSDTFANLVAANSIISAGKTVTATDVPDSRLGDGTTHWLDLASSFATGLFGDGSDSDVTIAGTVTLTRDMYYRNLTVPVSTELKTAGYAVFVQNTLTWAGTISTNGNNAVADVPGAAIIGRATAPAGAAGVTGVGAAGFQTGNPFIGGGGGAGGAGTSGAGGIATANSTATSRGGTREAAAAGQAGSSGCWPVRLSTPRVVSPRPPEGPVEMPLRATVVAVVAVAVVAV